MTDYYPDEEGVLVDGISVGWVQLSTTCVAMDSLKFDTATAGNIVMKHADDYEGVGVAMRAGSSSDYVPVLFYGVAKMTLAGTCVVGSPVCSATTGGQILRLNSWATNTYFYLLHGLCYTGTVEVLGKALQGGTTGDEILILVSPL
jgi:hypothetical protein